MSKIGRQYIDISDVQVDIQGREIHFKGAKASGVHELPKGFKAIIEENMLKITPDLSGDNTFVHRNQNREWGLNRALIANKIRGSRKPFIVDVEIHGLGYKAALSGKKLVLDLGYGKRKINFDLPDAISVSIDKTGQRLAFESSDNVSLGIVVSRLKLLRPTEPYKGKGIRRADDVIIRKSGKKKS